MTADATYGEAIYLHVESTLGPIELVWHEIVSDDIHVDIFPVSPTDNHPYWVIVTSGMSDKPMQVGAEIDDPESVRYAELVMLLPPDWFGEGFESRLSDPAVFYPVRLLKILARYPHQSGRLITKGNTVSFGESIGPGAPFTAVVIDLPISLPEEFHRAVMPDGEVVNFYALYPIHEDELEFALEEDGRELLLRIADEGGWDLYDPNRRSVLSGRN